MQIDPRIQLPGDSQPEPVKNSRSGATQSSAATNTSSLNPAAGEDTFSLSSTHGEVQTLAASLANVPEVRAGRVNQLQQQIQSGQYQPDSGKVAEAIIADHSRINAKV
jgi:flagellar biosynthesis anti-sigma factor FlgM